MEELEALQAKQEDWYIFNMYTNSSSQLKGGSGKSTLVASLASVLDADIVDHDPQGTLRVGALFAGRLTPATSPSKKIVIHDAPPTTPPK